MGKEKDANKKKKKSKLPIILAIVFLSLLILAAGIFTVYPFIANYVNDKYQSEVHSTYDKKVEVMDTTELDKVRQDAIDYNEFLQAVTVSVKDMPDYDKFTYDELLNITGTGIMGYVEVPKIDVNLPIYHGTEEYILQQGIGHLYGSSLPVGGESTHAVLTGHSGVASKRLFSDLDKVEEGDVFYIHVLNETLAYQVREINIVLPYEVDLLTIQHGEDKCTLITCTPYSVNTHRLLVTGYRIPYEEAVEAQQTGGNTKITPTESTWKSQYFKALIYSAAAAVAVLLFFIILFIITSKKKKKKKAQKAAKAAVAVPVIAADEEDEEGDSVKEQPNSEQEQTEEVASDGEEVEHDG